MAAKAKTDPFADGAAEETPATETPDVTVDVAPSGVTEVSITLKGGRDFDAPWCVIRADSTQAALDALDDTMQELLKAAAKYGKAFAELGAGARPAAAKSGGSAQSSRPAPGPKDHPNGKKEFCQHGEMQYKTGITKTGKNQGKTWGAFDCPDGECGRKWDND